RRNQGSGRLTGLKAVRRHAHNCRSASQQTSREITTMNLPRRTFVHLAAGAAALPAVLRIARGPTLPTPPLNFIAPYSPGGSADPIMRALASATERHLGQSIVIENKGGAGGTLGAAQMPAARPDGHTIAQMPVAAFRYPFITKTAYNPAIDLAYIIHVY